MEKIKYEMFCLNTMEALLNNDDIDNIFKCNLLKYYKKRNGSVIKVTYDYGKGDIDARLYAKEGLSSQCFKRDICNALEYNYYWDIDMINAQLTILLKICGNRGWICSMYGYERN